jgi:hypothetical protein
MVPVTLARASTGLRASGPRIHENLASYLLYGGAPAEDAPLTMAEAMRNGSVRLHETNNVNRLEIENLGDHEVFVQAGDIVKGGQQDRVLTVSFVLPPRSGRAPVGAFCVEQGRWTKRGNEDATRFSSAEETIPSRLAKLAMRMSGPRQQRGMESAQGAIWREVAVQQHKYAAAIGAPVAAPASRSSLQLTLENEKLRTRMSAYIEAVSHPRGEDFLPHGIAFAIDGAINSVELYASPALFAKAEAKLLRAAAAEAIASSAASGRAAPRTEQVLAFIAAADQGAERIEPIDPFGRLIVRESANAIAIEAQRVRGSWVHRSYVAKS